LFKFRRFQEGEFKEAKSALLAHIYMTSFFPGVVKALTSILMTVFIEMMYCSRIQYR